MSTSAWYPFETHNLLDCINDTEYAALSSAQKSILGLIVSAGTINFSTGSTVRIKIENMFPVGTVTRTNIEALLTYIPSPM